MKKNILLRFATNIIFLSGTCIASPLQTTYRDSSGVNKPILFTTTTSNTNLLKSLSYKDNNGEWKQVTVTEQICGTDTDNKPIICNPIATNMIGSANGIAGLDDKSRLTSSILSDSIITGPRIDGTVLSTVYSSINPQLTANGDGPFYWWDGNSIMRIGGTPITLPHSPYGSQAGTYESLVLSGVPNGGYTAGCALCLFMEPNRIKQAAISAVDFQGGTIPSADGVQLYAGPVNANFDLILPVASYTATSVTISGTLTSTELSHIQPMMTIFTNSKIPGVTATTPGEPDYYMGVVKSVSTTGNSTTINVYGWGEQLHKSTGEVPSITSLETYFWTNQTTPVVGIGGFNKTFARNVYMSYDGSKAGATGTAATSLIHEFTGEEMDFNVSNETRTGAVSFAGYGVSINMPPDHTNVLTHGSSDFYAGGNAPHHFLAGDSCYLDASGYYDQSAFEGLATWIGGACQLGSLETTLGRYDQEVAEFDGRTTGSPDFRMMYQVSESVKGSGTAVTNIVPKLGVVIGGEHGLGVDTGSEQANIQWNWNSYYGGLAFCGYGKNCGLVLDGNGVPHIAQSGLIGGSGLTIGKQPGGHVAGLGEYVDTDYAANLLEIMRGTISDLTLDTAGNLILAGNVSAGLGGQFILTPATGAGAGVGNYLTTDGYANLTVHASNGGASTIIAGRTIETATYTLNSLPSASHDGEHAWCSDCQLNGIIGVEAYWHTSASKWTDSQNNNLTK
ncbi:hypothetical protein QMA67_04350 [Gluconobacter japonicus]|uniref:hypothetical protein n=1 Tax=Gluconobacter japonicus TaxID=376620 RepID=UPI0024AD7E63|nr:hypothetical protein [Gluconobacter japonicus]MDI6652176.1 hypothetical protein [Gluconobacter japonicus]